MNMKKLNSNWMSVLAIILLTTAWSYNFNLFQTPLVGDQAAHVMQALSIANDGDLKFDSGDLEYWQHLRWTDNPNGLFFQKYSGGYAFSKPYGYSGYAAVFVKVFDGKGFLFANCSLFIALNILSYLILRRFYRNHTAALLTITFTLFSSLYMYIFTAHSELFLAVILALYVYAICILMERKSKLLFYLSAAIMALLVSEKITMILVLIPLLMIVIRQYNLPNMIFYLITFCGFFFIFIYPYLHYSDFLSWNPYSGERYYSRSAVPFSEVPATTGFRMAASGQYFTIDFLMENLIDSAAWKVRLASFYYYFFGAYTGILVFMPLSFIVMFLSVARVIRGKYFSLLLALIGLFSYVLFYVVLFPHNYYGGFQSIGNRYFLQVCPIILLLLVLLRLSNKNAVIISLVSVAISLLFIHHHHFQPQKAFRNVLSASLLQSSLPFEKTVTGLRKNLNQNQAVNPSLIPQRPLFRASNHPYYRFDKAKNTLYENSKTFVPLDSNFTALTKASLSSISIFSDPGFHVVEATHIWSRKHSFLVIENGGVDFKLVLQSYPSDNVLRISGNILNEEIIFHGGEFQGFLIRGSQLEEDFLYINFTASNSGTSSSDARDLSFAVTLVVAE